MNLKIRHIIIFDIFFPSEIKYTEKLYNRIKFFFFKENVNLIHDNLFQTCVMLLNRFVHGRSNVNEI